MLSEAFHDFAIANSAGSLSKRTKWKLIAEFEFPLPPIERQKEILEVLEKLEEVDRKTKESIDSLNVLLENTIVEQFNREDGSVLLGDLCEEKRVLVQPPFDTQKKYVGFEHLEPVNVDIPSCGDIADVVSAKAEFYEGNILYGKIRPYLRKAAITPCAGLCSSDLIVIEAKENVSNVVIASILTSSRFSQIAMNSAKGTKMPRADWNTLLKTKLPKSFKTKSSHLERVFLSIYAQKKLLQSKINNITNVRNFVISGNGGVQ
jgi:type I restriction enzyme S subunit